MDDGSPCFAFPTDDELFSALRSGDRTIYNQGAKCLDSYKQSFFNHILKNIEKGANKVNLAEVIKDLEDHYHDALIKMLECIRAEPPKFEVLNNRFRGIRSYLFTIGENLYIGSFRKRIRDLGTKSHLKEIEELTARMNQFENNSAEERRLELMKAMKTLKEDCIELVKLRFTLGLTVKEIAAMRNSPANTIAQQMLRCREQIKKELTA